MSATVKNYRAIKGMLCKLPKLYKNFYIQWKLANGAAMRHTPRVDWVRNPEPGKM